MWKVNYGSTLSELICRNSYPSGFVNTSNTNGVNRGQGSLTSHKKIIVVPIVNTIDANDIKLLIFNGNGVDDPE